MFSRQNELSNIVWKWKMKQFSNMHIGNVMPWSSSFSVILWCVYSKCTLHGTHASIKQSQHTLKCYVIKTCMHACMPACHVQCVNAHMNCSDIEDYYLHVMQNAEWKRKNGQNGETQRVSIRDSAWASFERSLILKVYSWFDSIECVLTNSQNGLWWANLCLVC